jgi:hypothetical protein
MRTREDEEKKNRNREDQRTEKRVTREERERVM